MERNLPKDWTIVPLGKLIFQKKDRYNRDVKEIEVLSVTNEQGFVKSEDFFKKQVFSKDIKGYKIVKKGNFAYNPSRINVGSIALLSNNIEIAAVSPIYEVFIPKENILGKYLLLFLKSSLGLNLINYYSEGTVRHSLKYQGLSKIPIPLPPLPTQHKIVEILEETDNLRKLRQQADKKMRDLIPSLFVEMFGDPATNPKGWKFSKLEELTINITDGKHGDCRNSHDSGYFFISAKDINNGEIDYSNARQIDKDDFFEVHKRTKFEISDVLITNSGSIGKLAVAKDSETINKTTFQKSVALIKPKKELLHSIYLMYALDIKKRDLVKTSSGSSQKNLLLSQIRSYKIPIPPLSLQQEFAKLVEETEAEKARQAESKKKLDELFNSLMQRAFKGELVA